MKKYIIINIILDYLSESDLEKIKASEILNAANFIYECKFTDLKMIYDYINIKFNING